MPALSRARRVLLALLACFAFASIPLTSALGATHHHHSTHHRSTHHRTSHKKSCSGDGDHDHSEPARNDGDGCGV